MDHSPSDLAGRSRCRIIYAERTREQTLQFGDKAARSTNSLDWLTTLKRKKEHEFKQEPQFDISGGAQGIRKGHLLVDTGCDKLILWCSAQRLPYDLRAEPR